MNLKQTIDKQFAELLEDAERLQKEENRTDISWDDYATNSKHTKEVQSLWVRGQHLAQRVCGRESIHYQRLVELHDQRGVLTRLAELSGVLDAARRDFENGLFSSMRALLQSEVFDSELEQAAELLSKGYATASAVIAGTVLETALRELCERNNIARGKLDRMNAELAKKGAYNANTAKLITAISGIRNSAAHGKPDEFTDGGVKSMIDDIGRFLAQHME